MTGLLAVIYLVPQPDDLSHSEGDGGKWACRKGGACTETEDPQQTFLVHPLARVGLGRAPGYTLGLTLLCPGLRLRSVVLLAVR